MRLYTREPVILSKVSLSKVSLSKVSLSKVSLSKVSLSKVSLSKVSLSKVSLSKVSLSKVSLSKVSLSKVSLSKVSLSKVSNIDSCHKPRGFYFIAEIRLRCTTRGDNQGEMYYRGDNQGEMYYRGGGITRGRCTTTPCPISMRVPIIPTLGTCILLSGRKVQER